MACKQSRQFCAPSNSCTKPRLLWPYLLEGQTFLTAQGFGALTAGFELQNLGRSSGSGSWSLSVHSLTWESFTSFLVPWRPRSFHCLISVNKAVRATMGKGTSLEAFYNNISSKKQKPRNC